MKITSQKIDPLLRHEVLNAMTTLSFGIDTAQHLALKDKKNFADLIAWASFLVAQPEVFHGENIRVLIQTVHLEDLMELVIVLQDPSKQSSITWAPLKEDYLIMTDKNRAKELLSALLRFIAETSDSIKISVKGETLKFKHGQAKITLPDLKPFDVLSSTKMSPFERRLSCLLQQASVLGLKIVSKKGVIEVAFKASK